MARSHSSRFSSPPSPPSQEPSDGAEEGIPRGARLGVDVGRVRIGVAASDPDGLVATPVETVRRVLPAPGTLSGTSGDVHTAGPTADIVRIVTEVVERFAAVVYVGLPRHLSGQEGAATADARDFASRLTAALTASGERTEVRLVDERMTTVSAHQALHAAGRKSKTHRSVIDQAAAVIILQSALDAERAKGQRAGELVETEPVHDTH